LIPKLRELGHTGTRVDELGMSKSSDYEIFEYARQHDMVIITADMDFTRILAYTKSGKPSTIVFHLKNPSHEKMVKYLKETLTRFEVNLQKGAIILIKEERIRVRNLPIK
jgi:predicted nuclease of predicted toxin-antitoxin system